VAFDVADGVAVGRLVGVAVAVGRRVGVAVAVGRPVGEAVAVGRPVGEAVAVGRPVGEAVVVVALPVEVALALDVGVPVPLAVAELAPVPPDEGEGVRTAPPEAVLLVVTCGLGVKTDGAVEEGDPPPLQAATVTARRAAPAAARPTRSRAGTVRRTFMRPPRMTGGQWRRSTHLSMCHPNRQGKSERADNSPPFRPADVIPGADG
jgi:hypothetical protein